jgi:hypothetical protein
MGGTTRNYITFANAGIAAPANGLTPAAGTKLVIFPSQNAGNTDYGIGYNTGEMWLSSATSTTKVSFYAGTTRVGWFSGTVGVGSGLFLGETTLPGLLYMSSTTSNSIVFADGGVALPSITATRSAGSKIVIKALTGTGTTDYAIGYNTNEMWFAAPASASSFISFYGDATKHIAMTTSNGVLSFLSAGSGVAVKDATASGTANCRMGLATLGAGGTVTVTNGLVTANTRIFLSVQSTGGTPGAVRVSARSASISFTITSTSTSDTSTVAWLLIEPIA